jgi:hypothetical protein
LLVFFTTFAFTPLIFSSNTNHFPNLCGRGVFLAAVNGTRLQLTRITGRRGKTSQVWYTKPQGNFATFYFLLLISFTPLETNNRY